MRIADTSLIPKPVSRFSTEERKRALQVAELLAKRFPGEPRPALTFNSPYECISAIALSAQTTDDNVNKVTPTLFARFPDPASLASASQLEVEEIVHSLGFYRNKARNLIAMAQKIMSDFGGEVPRTMAELVTLPGVARKTANLVLAESYGISAGIAVDTHVYRVSHRLNLSRAKTPEKTEGDLCALFKPEDWHLVNYWMIMLGRAECDAKKPLCEECALVQICPRKMKF